MVQSIAVPETGGQFSPAYWNVVFLEREIERWWDALSPRWARHVLCYGYSPVLNAWLIVNPIESRTLIEVVPDPFFDDRLSAMIAAGATILRIEGREARPEAGRLFQTCSSIVGRIIGVDSAWRPMALFRSLMRLEAEIRHRPNEHQSKGAADRCRNQGAPENSRATG